jgi:Transposase IS116/IS110/IS902 family
VIGRSRRPRSATHVTTYTAYRGMSNATPRWQIIAEVGATAATFPSPKHVASCVGVCPVAEESAGVNYSHR